MKIADTSLSTRTKNILINYECDDFSTVSKLRSFISEHGETYFSKSMPLIGRATAKEIIDFLEATPLDDVNSSPHAGESVINITINQTDYIEEDRRRAILAILRKRGR